MNYYKEMQTILDLYRYCCNFRDGEHKDFKLPPLTSFSDEAQKSLSFLKVYTSMKMSTKDINSLNIDIISTQEFLFNLVNNRMNLDILLKVKPEIKDNVFYEFLESSSQTGYFPLLKYVSENYLDKRVLEDKSFIENQIILKAENLNYIKNPIIRDDILIKIVKDKDLEGLSFNSIFNLRDNKWWEERPLVLKDLLDNNTLLKSSININEISEVNVLNICKQKLNVIPRYLKKFGFNDENAKKIIASSISNESDGLTIEEKLEFLDEINILIQSGHYTVYNYRSYKGFALFKEITHSCIDKIVSAFKENEKELGILNIEKENNFIALSYFFHNPHKFSNEEKDKYISYIYKNVDYNNFNKKDFLKNILDYDDHMWGNGYRFKLLPVFAERWDEDINKLKNISLDDFYNKFMIKEELRLINQGLIKSDIKSKKIKF